MDLMTAEQAGHFLQSQANHQSSSLANGDMPHAQHAPATHNGHQVAAGLAQVTAHTACMLLQHNHSNPQPMPIAMTKSGKCETVDNDAALRQVQTRVQLISCSQQADA